jgi:hypothetical protein
MVLVTALAVFYVAAKEFIWAKEEEEEGVTKKVKKTYKWWDYYTGKWAYDALSGNDYVIVDNTAAADKKPAEAASEQQPSPVATASAN